MNSVLTSRLFDAVENNDWPTARRCLNFQIPADILDEDGKAIMGGFIRHRNWPAIRQAVDLFPEAFTLNKPTMYPNWERDGGMLQYMSVFMDDSREAVDAFISVGKRFPYMLFATNNSGNTATVNLLRFSNCGAVVFPIAEAFPEIKNCPSLVAMAALKRRYFLPMMVASGFALPTEAYFKNLQHPWRPDEIRRIINRLPDAREAATC